MGSYKSGATENVNGTKTAEIIYSERLYPSPGVWAINIIFPLTALLIFAPINFTIGIAATITMFLLMTAFWVITTPQIRITGDALYAGKAAISRGYLGPAEGFRKQGATEERGIRLHGGAYLLIRGWIGPVVKIQITDAEDSHPYWLLSTRNPEKLVQALKSQVF